jgi:hypothetical protein
MAKPVFMEEGKHSYGEQTMAGYGAGGVKTVHGPIYVKEFSKHNYQEKPKEDHLNTVQLKGKHTLFPLQVNLSPFLIYDVSPKVRSSFALFKGISNI